MKKNELKTTEPKETEQEAMTMSNTDMLLITLDVLAFKFGGFTLTKKDVLDYLASDKKVINNNDENGNLVYSIVNEEDAK